LIWFGWGSFTHLTARAEQVGVLSAALRLAPRAPVVISFFLRARAPQAQGRSARLRRAIRAAFRSLGAKYEVADGLSCDYAGGFVYSYGAAEIEQIARDAGYRVALFQELPFPHAVLRPARADSDLPFARGEEIPQG
jgi:hypothetical protein